MSSKRLDKKSYLALARERGFLDYYIRNIGFDDIGLLNFSDKDCDDLIANWSKIKEFNSVSCWSTSNHLVPSWFLLLSNKKIADKFLSMPEFPEIFSKTASDYFKNIDNFLYPPVKNPNVFNDKSLLNIFNMHWMFKEDIKIFEKILDKQQQYNPTEFVKDYVVKHYVLLSNKFLKSILFESKYSPSRQELIEIDRLLLAGNKGMISSIVHSAAVADDNLDKVVNSVDLINNLIESGVKDTVFSLMKPNEKYSLKDYLKEKNKQNANENLKRLNFMI